MRGRALAALSALAVVVWAPAFLAGQAQSSAKTTKTWTPTRTPDGQPDLQGVWQTNTYTPLERPSEFAGKALLTEAEALEFFNKAAAYNRDRDPGVHYHNTEYLLDTWQQKGVRVNRRTSLIVDPPDGRLPPLTPEAKKRLAANPARRTSDLQARGLYERCITGYWRGPMLKGTGSSDIAGLSGADVGIGAEGEVQILQIPGYVVILAQSNNAARIIPLDGRPHLSPDIPQWLGDARGRWEGNTLVIEGTNFNDQLRFLGSTGALRLVERLTRVDADTLRYQLTVDDPKTWTKAWSAELEWPKTAGPIYEFACHEANYGLLNVLTGERVTEEAKKKGETK